MLVQFFRDWQTTIVNNFRRIIAVDPSLTATGWAIFSIAKNAPIHLGVIRPKGTEFPLSVRLHELQAQVSELFSKINLSSEDILVCEGPAPLVKNPQSSLKVEHVRGIFETLARSFGAVVPGRINPRTIQRELLGMKGRQLGRTQVKEWARKTVEQLYGTLLPSIPIEDQKKTRAGLLSQDIVDALLIGTLAVSKTTMAIRTGDDVTLHFTERTERGRRANRGGYAAW